MSSAPVWPAPGVFTAPPWVMPPLLGVTSRAAVPHHQWAPWAAPPAWETSYWASHAPPPHQAPCNVAAATIDSTWGADAAGEDGPEDGSGSEYEVLLSDEWAARFAATELRREQRKQEAKRAAKAEKAAQRRQARSTDAHAAAIQVADAAKPVEDDGAMVVTSPTE